MNNFDLRRLVEIRREMIELLEEAKNLIRFNNIKKYNAAKAYWIGSVDVGLCRQI